MELRKPMPPLEDPSPPTLQVDVRDERGRFLPGNSGNGGRRPGSRNKLAQDFIDTAYKLWKEGGETALREVMLKQPAKFCALIAALQPQHFKHEVEHTIAGLSPEEVHQRLAESRAKLLEAGVDLEALPVVEALPAPVRSACTKSCGNGK
jgi:hypothetical protein